MTSVRPVSDLVGYAVEELRAFLLAADRRAEELRQAVAVARASVPDPPPSAAARRNRVAEAWLAAQQQAAQIRGDAEREARSITEAARRIAGEAGGISRQPGWVGATGDAPVGERPLD